MTVGIAQMKKDAIAVHVIWQLEEDVNTIAQHSKTVVTFVIVLQDIEFIQIIQRFVMILTSAEQWITTAHIFAPI